MIECPGPCWQCGMTSDGIGTCKLSSDCREIATKVGLRGGAGCAGCAVDPAGGAGSPLAAAVLALAAVLARRRRRA